MKSTLLIIFILFFSVANSEELLDIKKINDNTVLLRFNSRVSYATDLSEDKKNIYLSIQNTENKLKISNKKIHSSIIKEIFIQYKNDGLLLNFILKSNSGFNTFQLPYSNSIVIDVFDWKDVTTQEDKYRSGLFAYESSLYNQAILLFDDVKTEIPEAQGMLGLVYLLEDSLEKSFYQLSASAQKETYIPDVYAALEQIYREKENDTKADYYKDLFFFKLGIADTIFEYPKLIFSKTKIDSLSINEVIDSNSSRIVPNLVNNRFSNLFDKNNSEETTNANARKKLKEEDAFLNMKDWLKYIIIVLLIGGLFILSLYLKWRKGKLDKQTKIASKSFEKELAEENKKRQDSQQSIVLDRYDENRSADKKPSISELPEREVTHSSSIINSSSNITIDDVNKKIEAKKILNDINKLSSTNTNLDISKSKLDNNELKSKLYSKFNVGRDSNNKS